MNSIVGHSMNSIIGTLMNRIVETTMDSIVGNSMNISAIVTYAPTNEVPDEVKDRFYDQHESAASGVPPHNILLVLGNLNAVTGGDRVGYEAVIGKFGSGIPKDKTMRLAYFCASFGLAVTSSWFRRHDIYRWSWYSTMDIGTKRLTTSSSDSTTGASSDLTGFFGGQKFHLD